MNHRLVPHPANPGSAIVEVAASVARKGSRLSLAFTALGDRDAVCWPPRMPPGFSDELWRHTCFEAFVSGETGDGYVEINLAPSRRWAAYRFDGYRAGMARAAAAPVGAVRCLGHEHTVAAVFDLPDLPGGAAWRLGLSAVIEMLDGSKSYFALAHPPGPPDFHNRDCFIALLPAPVSP